MQLGYANVPSSRQERDSYFSSRLSAQYKLSAGPSYGKDWGKPGDVVGAAIDLDQGTVAFAVNGDWSSGIAYRGVKVHSDGYSPAFFVRQGYAMRVNIGSRPFKYGPPDLKVPDVMHSSQWSSLSEAAKKACAETVVAPPFRSVLSALVKMKPSVSRGMKVEASEAQQLLMQGVFGGGGVGGVGSNGSGPPSGMLDAPPVLRRGISTVETAASDGDG